MAVQFTPYTPLLVLGAAVSAALAAYGWRFRADAGARWFVLMMVGAAAWSFTYALELSAATRGTALFWHRLGWIPYDVVLAGVLLLALELGGREEWVTRRTLPLFFLWPALTVALVYTNEAHGFVWTGVEIVDLGGFVVLDYVGVGPWYWAETAYGFTVSLVAVGLFGRQAVVRSGLYRKQAIAMAAGIGVAVLAAAADVVYPLSPVELTPLFFVPVGLLFALGLFRYRVLDLVPIARELAIEHMTDAVVVFDADERLVDFNSAAAALFDLDDAALGEDAQGALAFDPGAGSAIASGDEIVVAEDGEPRYFEADCVTVRDGRDDVRGRLCLLHDVSERRNRERWLRTLTENASDVVVVVDREGRVRHAGQSIERTLGYDVGDVVGRDARSVLHPDDQRRVREGFDALLGVPDEPRRGEYRVRHADGSYRTFEVRVTNLLDDPVVGGVVVNAHDVTERKARERRLERQNEQLDAFASVISHDLRNPLNVAQGFLDVARGSGDPAHFDRVSDAHDRMEEIIADVLALARAGRDLGELDPTSIRSAALDAWANVDTADGTLDADAVDGLVVEADRTMALQLFENLFRNSVEHGSTGDPAGVDGEERADPGVSVRVGRTDGGFYVEDDGPGIPEADRERVFESGTTESSSGTGIGLAIVRSVAEAHGWSVSIEDAAAGTGARFAFAFDSGVDVSENGVEVGARVGDGDGNRNGE